MKKTFDIFLKEGFIGVQDVQSDSDILRLAIEAELDAASLYEILSKKTSNPDIKKILLDVRDEEHAHIGEFETLLKMIDKSYIKNKQKGYNEVEDEIF